MKFKINKKPTPPKICQLSDKSLTSITSDVNIEDPVHEYAKLTFGVDITNEIAKLAQQKLIEHIKSFPSNTIADFNIKLLFLKYFNEVMFELENSENSVMNRLKDDDLTPSEFVNMNIHDRHPELVAKIHEESKPPEEKEGAHTCRRCKSKWTDYYQMQTRSADESMTTFVRCLKCNKRWKE